MVVTLVASLTGLWLAQQTHILAAGRSGHAPCARATMAAASLDRMDIVEYFQQFLIAAIKDKFEVHLGNSL